MRRESKIRQELVGRVDDLLADQFDSIERAGIESAPFDSAPKAKCSISVSWSPATNTPHISVGLSFSSRTSVQMDADLDLDQVEMFPREKEGGQ